MIASVHGEVISIGEDSLVVQTGSGIGLLVHVPTALTAQSRPGERIFLYTSLIVRQDALVLYGFEREEDRQYFTLVLGVDGIGPRTALSVLSTLSPDAIRRAVWSEQPEIFSRVPGVGKRTAQKILLHLQDRIKGDRSALEAVAGFVDVDAEVMDALTGLGYSIVEAQAALQAIPRDAPKDVEERLRIALQYFST